jgi:multidrug efflux pump subunit AcrA (membrane-fusion protein)
VLLPVIILGGAIGGSVWFVKTKPSPKKQKRVAAASVVETTAVAGGSHKVVVAAMGRVVPVQEITLQPEITGLVVWKNSNLVPGGIIKSGEALLRIDRRNYEAARKQQLAAFEKAKVAYQIELSRSEVAEEEWKMMGGPEAGGQRPEAGGPGPGPAAGGSVAGGGSLGTGAVARAKSLALREPQLRAAKIAVLAAGNLLEKASIDLERSEIKAPFNAVVISESIDIGQFVSPQSHLAKLAGTDAFWVEASLPVRELQWFNKPDRNGKTGPKVTVLYDIGTAEPVKFQGVLARVLSSLDNAAKMVKVLIRVDDPLMLEQKKSKVKLLSGAYVKVLIDGVTLDNVIEIKAGLLREGNRVWVMNSNSVLEIKDVDVIRRQSGTALIKNSITDGARIVSSNISAPIPGMRLKQLSETGGRRSAAGGRRPGAGGPGDGQTEMKAVKRPAAKDK